MLSRVPLFATPWTIARQALLSVGFFKQEYWSGLPFPSPGDLPDPGVEPESLALQADPLLCQPPGEPREKRQDVLTVGVFSLSSSPINEQTARYPLRCTAFEEICLGV